MSRNRQAGFALIEAVLIVAFLAALGGVSYVVIKHRSTASTANTATTASTATITPASTIVPAAPDIKSTDDLTKAEQTLDNTNLDAGTSDTSQLDAQVSSF